MKIINKILIVLSCILSIIYSLKIVGTDDNILIKLSSVLVIFIPIILRKFKINISYSSEFILICFIFFSHILGSIVGLYDKTYWFDTFVHFLSGIVVSFFTIEILKKSKIKINHIFEIIFILGISSLTATLWEIFEFVCDKLLDKDMQHVITTGVDDTMKDLIVALLGTILFSISYMYEYIKDKKLIITKFIKSL